MGKSHLKRLNAPKSWPISRKRNMWITRPSSGPHKLEESMPLNTILKELLKYPKITKEVKNILNKKEILVDKIPRKDIGFPVGIYDVIEIPKTKEYFLFLINKKGKCFLKKIDEKDAESKPLKIIGKTVLKKNKMQLNFYNGNNLITDKKDYKVGDTLLISLKDKKILKYLKMDKGSLVYLTGGKHGGCYGVVGGLSSSDDKKKDMIELNIDDKKIKTLRKFAFVVDKK